MGEWGSGGVGEWGSGGERDERKIKMLFFFARTTFKKTHYFVLLYCLLLARE